MASLLDEFGLVGFVPMSIKDEESVTLVMAHMDHSVQYGDDVEPKQPAEPRDESE